MLVGKVIFGIFLVSFLHAKEIGSFISVKCNIFMKYKRREAKKIVVCLLTFNNLKKKKNEFLYITTNWSFIPRFQIRKI